MRPAFALILVIAILGIVQGYMSFVGSIPAPKPITPPTPERSQEWTADVTLSFPAAPDGFEISPASLVMLLNGQEVVREQRVLSAGNPLELSGLPLSAAGRNELYVKAWPGGELEPQQRAVRVRFLRGAAPIAEKTFWSRPGEPAEGAWTFELEESPVHAR